MKWEVIGELGIAAAVIVIEIVTVDIVAFIFIVATNKESLGRKKLGVHRPECDKSYQPTMLYRKLHPSRHLAKSVTGKRVHLV